MEDHVLLDCLPVPQTVKFRQEKSAQGHPADILKSAVQKYVRRNKQDLALRALFEYMTFLNGDIETRVKSLRTNMRNRIAVMIVEDIGPANPALLPFFYENMDTLWGWAETIYLMAQGEHTRAVCGWRRYAREHAPEEATEEELADLLDHEHPDAMAVAYTLSQQKPEIPYGRLRKEGVQIFRVLEGRVPDDLHHAALYFYRQLHGGRGDHELFWVFLIQLVIQDWGFYDLDRPDDGAIEDALNDVAQGEPVPIEDVVYDKHTKTGRLMGRDQQHWEQEARIVVNEVRDMQLAELLSS